VSLVEALVVLFLASVLILALAIGLQTSVETDGRTNRQQRGNAGLTSVAEVVRRFDVDFKVCCPTDLSCDIEGAPTLAKYYENRIQSSINADADSTLDVDFEVTEVDFWKSGTLSPDPTIPGRFVPSAQVVLPDPEGVGVCTLDGGTDPNRVNAVRLKIEVVTGNSISRGEVVKRKPLPGEERSS
jgi:type II secretory pathway pseudopilin PulG